jgi:hypothetical protein
MAARPAPLATRAAANGTCQSRVEPFGYKCEEHTVRKTDNSNVRSSQSESCDRCRPNFTSQGSGQITGVVVRTTVH